MARRGAFTLPTSTIAERGTLVTRDQQKARKTLEQAQSTYLKSYGWREADGRWEHSKVGPWKVPTHDALMLTREKPQIGWP
jgi:hypothetical protein